MKTIIEKLDLTKYPKKAILNLPKHVTELDSLTSTDFELKQKQYELIFAFVFNLSEMKQIILQVINEERLAKAGYLFLAYPKKGNKEYSEYIHRDEILSGLEADEAGYIPNSHLKFSRMVSFNETFTVIGLKIANAKNKKKTEDEPDYQSFIPNVEELLAGNPELLAFYQALAPGYQKSWARYIYSAKQPATKAKREQETIRLLKTGQKSK
ncbi:YdeI/OmpD-associated family protein [Listeria sp. PSOL-1]|uniref:YdeI/OmpD-associated family protein n=1 Tax=Listeria sp. PSOL-1 TaxID=1844999 RepID=UPI0013D24C9B|nr:YdeI/OmpD-associated family protein [Listeria sp. PSOL-1]